MAKVKKEVSIDEAVSILNNDPPRNPRNTDEFERAYDLGIEALKAVKESRRLWGDRGVPRLPGEKI